MNDAKLETLIKPLIKIYDNIELELIKDIAMRLNTYNGVSGSLKWYLDKLQEMGGFTKDNLALLSEYAGMSQRQVREILTIAGYKMTGFDTYKKYFDDGLLKIDPTVMYESVAIKNLIEDAIKNTNSIMDTIKTTAVEKAKEEYMNILTDAYIKVGSGVFSYDQAIKQALDSLAKEGIKVVTYKSGKELSIESTVRRDILTKVHQLAGDISVEQAKELNTNLVYVTQHLGARIRTKYTKEDYEVHAEWQGKVYMLNGKSEKYDNFYEKTGYGEMLGLCGVNCRHHFYPTFEWEKHPERIDMEENEKAYKLSQQQRSYERKLRSLKREKEETKIVGDKDDLKNINKKMSAFNKEYTSFLEDNNLKRDYGREYVVKSNKLSNNSVPHYDMYSHKIKYTKEQEYQLFKEVNANLDKEIDIESKWSGKLNIGNDVTPAKEWDCSITIGIETLEQEVQHELLHARSISYFNEEEYIKFPFEEEATVEFLNKHLLLKQGKSYYDNAYVNMVKKLEEISDIIDVDKFKFAKQLFKEAPHNRRNWIINQVKHSEKENSVLELLKEAFPKW